MHSTLLIALAALAWSPTTPDNATVPELNAAQPTPVSTKGETRVDSGAGPAPGELRTFGDWTVGCDNGRACQANALVPDLRDRDKYLLLLVERDGAPDARFRLTIPLPDRPIIKPVLLVGGKPIARPSPASGDKIATLTLDRAQVTTLANGKTAALAAFSRSPVSSASLLGLAAALLYMDAQQHRVGTRSALRKPGSGTAPPPPPLPVIAVPPRSDAKAKTLTVAAATLIGRDNAFCDYTINRVESEAHRLDATHSLVLVAHPCNNGAYNLFSSAFVVGEDGKPTTAQFDSSPGLSPDDGAQSLVNADWDADDQRLTTYAKGRGLGDCGSGSVFVWDGARFRLIALAAMNECRGSLDFIPVWRAETVTR